MSYEPYGDSGTVGGGEASELRAASYEPFSCELRATSYEPEAQWQEKVFWLPNEPFQSERVHWEAKAHIRPLASGSRLVARSSKLPFWLVARSSGNP